ncbi:hypothetical protein H2198_006084 [Neophaeococcomyces mojaviensis]|uniref:Uncharacterized protein n=1 Tax=Neophaeococcomyces mojaviensis TaxID=3383035 RepID=A0ACC3A3X2_9EURO|nr:hypothetical protein H2198_006084 [Knufia sp. JES_112]
MSLSKAETFHQPSSPASEDDPVFSVAYLQKRSTTYTRSSFASWLYKEREAADAIAHFEATFSGARGTRPATRRRSAQDFEDSLLAKAQRASSPVDSGIGSSIGSPSEKNLSRTLEKALDLTSNKDSALGDSVSSSVAENLVQGWLSRCVSICSSGINTSFTDTNSTKAPSTRSQKSSRSSHPAPLTIIRYPVPSTKKNTQPLLSQFARRQIYKRLFSPLLQETRFEDFRPIVAGARKNKNLRCLRDIEQALINQPVVSTIYPLLTKRRSNSTRKTLPVTASEYRAFGELTVQLVVDTFQHLSESEQRRSTDRAYENGYFLDLVQQVQQLAAHIGSSDTTVEDESAPSVEDEITLEGGLGETGTLAELVRWKNGEGVSLRTGLPYVAMPGFKRSASGLNSEDVERSMARRKKGYIPEIVNMPCSQPGCDKVFQRKCDLSKHEKTHSRPYKCSDSRCKFHEYGLPTEKELDRHMNDRHNTAPKMYKCKFCEFQTKRESNCKQHMEKKHDWAYHRAKGKDKATAMTPAQTPQTPGTGYSIIPSPASGSNWDGSASVSGSVSESPFEQPLSDFGYAQQYPAPLFPRNTAPVMSANDFDFNAPLGLNTNVNAYDNGPYLTPNSAAAKYTPQTPAYSTITPSPMMMDDNVVNYPYYGQGLPTPESAVMHSRQLSNAHELPPNMNMNQGMDDIMFTGNDMPQEDFQLFGGPFTHPSGGDATLFPAISSEAETEYTPEMFGTFQQVEFDDDFNNMINY